MARPYAPPALTASDLRPCSGDATCGCIEPVELLDGTTVHLRPMSPTDGPALVLFHEGLTDETTRLRFFNHHPHLTPRELERFTHVDHHDREALVIFDGPAIIAVGRYDRLSGTDDAEVAFVVADEWQHRGAATHLLHELADRARAEGLTRFLADTLAENRRMRDVFRHSGLVVGSEMAAGVIRVVLDLRLHPAGLVAR